MKKISFLLTGMLLSIAVFAQTVPHSISYQAVARNTTGTVVPNTTLTVIASILNNAPTGTVAYSEKFSVSTNQYGLFTMHLGQGTPVTGTFDGISWGGSSHWLKIEIDFANTGLFTLLGTSELLSVPYALFSENSGTGGPTGPSGNDGIVGPQGVTGPAGADGVNGATGPTGPSGNNGTNGTNGSNGSNGATGPTGPTGTAGANGATGAQGPIGVTGPGAGATGPMGPTGPAGGGGGASMKGVVNADGTIGSGTGYTVNHVSTGVYQITFSSTLSAAPILNITPEATASAGSSVPYLASNATSTADDEIFNVTFGSLNNNSICGAVAPGAGSLAFEYSNYTDLTPTTVTAGTPITSSVSIGFCNTFTYGTTFSVYIDLNQNGSFADAGESVYTATGLNPAAGGTAYPFTVTIPTSAYNGSTRLRVVDDENGVAPAEATYTWGETEDYTINIVGGTNNPTPPPPPAAAAVSRFVSIANITTTGFKVFVLSGGLSPVDQKFHFTAN